MLGSNASKKAADAQVKAAQTVADLAGTYNATGTKYVGDATSQANTILQGGYSGARDLLSQIHNSQVSPLLQPYQTAGSTALQSLQDVANKPMPSADQILAQDPGYAFRLQQGQQAIERAAAAAGGALGGGTLKSLTDYAQNASSAEYQNAFNRYITSQNQRYQQLAGVTGLGLTASQQGASLGAQLGQLLSGNMTSAATQQGANLTNMASQEYQGLLQTANTAGNAITGGGNARASGYVGSANAYNGALGSVANTAQTIGLLNYLNGGGTVQQPGYFALQGLYNGAYPSTPPFFPIGNP